MIDSKTPTAEPHAHQVAARVRATVCWLVRSGSDVVGPVSIALIERGLAAGKIPDDAEMSHADGGPWRRVADVFAVAPPSPTTASSAPTTLPSTPRDAPAPLPTVAPASSAPITLPSSAPRHVPAPLPAPASAALGSAGTAPRAPTTLDVATACPTPASSVAASPAPAPAPAPAAAFPSAAPPPGWGFAATPSFEELSPASAPYPEDPISIPRHGLLASLFG